MKIFVASLALLIAGLGSAQAETAKQKLQYIKDITGVSCSADRLTVRSAPNGPISVALPAPAYVSIIRGQLDAKGNSWLYVSDDKTKKPVGWVKLLDLSCI